MQLAFTGYHKSNVKKALNLIVGKSFKFNVSIIDKPKKEQDFIKHQPVYHGCNVADLTIYSLPIDGKLIDVKNLVKTKTPLGVQIELLPRYA